jgi:hypothetical protein
VPHEEGSEIRVSVSGKFSLVYLWGKMGIILVNEEKK